jgi:ubiquinone/menaquinone biosynthesis C-methylase UbiE
MLTKDYYRSYIADDNFSDLSKALVSEVYQFNPVHVLEFGCGTGKHLNTCETLGICTIGIDISPMNVQKAIHKYDLPCVICADETYLRHLCNIDCVFTCSVLDHIEDIDAIIAEFKRIANKAVVLAETNDRINEHYYPHVYEAYGFKKLDYSWLSDGDGANYSIWIWER